MIPVVVLAHGRVASALVEALAGVAGADAAAGFVAVDVPFDEGRDALAGRLRALAAGLDGGDGVLVVCDLAGSTPARCACEPLLASGRVSVVGGANLPMLLKLSAATRRGEGVTPATLARAAAESAVRAVRVLAEEPLDPPCLGVGDGRKQP